MKNKLLTLLAICGLSLPALSQTSDSVQYKNQLGIIASPSLQYLFQNNSLPVGLIYKRQTQPDQAWRYTIKGWFNKTSHPNWNLENASTFNTVRTYYFAEALIGYEWQQGLGKNWTFYYGADAGARIIQSNYSFDFSEFNPSTGFNFSQQHWNSSTLSFLLQPLAGIRFNVTPRLYLATETRIQISYGRTKEKTFETTLTDNQEPITKERATATTSTLNVNYSPLSNIQLVYKF